METLLITEIVMTGLRHLINAQWSLGVPLIFVGDDLLSGFFPSINLCYSLIELNLQKTSGMFDKGVAVLAGVV